MRKLSFKFSRNETSAPLISDEYSNSNDRYTLGSRHSKTKTHHRSATQDVMKEMNERAKNILESSSFDLTPKKLTSSTSSSPLALASASAKLSSRNSNRYNQRYFNAHQKGFARMEGIDQHYTVTSRNGPRKIQVQNRNFSDNLEKSIDLSSNLPKSSMTKTPPFLKYQEKPYVDKPSLMTPSRLCTSSLNLLNQTPEQDSPKRLSNHLISSSSKRRRVSEDGDMQEMNGSKLKLDYNENNLLSSRSRLRVNNPPKSPLKVSNSNLTLPTTASCINKTHIRSSSPTPSSNRGLSYDLPSLHHDNRPKLRLSRPSLKIQRPSPLTQNTRESPEPFQPNYKTTSKSSLRKIEPDEPLVVTKVRQKSAISSGPSTFSSTNLNTSMSASIHAGSHERIIRRTPSLNVLTSSSKDFIPHPSRIPVSSSNMTLSSLNNLGGAVAPMKTHGTTQSSYTSSLPLASSSLLPPPSPSSSLIPSLSASVLPHSSRLERSKYLTKSTPNLSKSSWSSSNNTIITGSSLRYTSGRNRCVSSNK